MPVIDLDPELWHRVIDVNLHGTFYMSRGSVAAWSIRVRAGAS